MLGLAMAGSPLAAQDWIALDGFEFFSPPTSFRMTDLDLRDPHVYLTIALPPPLPPTVCADFTDTPIPTTSFSFNAAIAQSFVSDTDPFDGFLDASSLLWFRPLRQDGALARLDTGSADCLAPAPPASCAPSASVPPQAHNYAAFASGTCLAPHAGTLAAPPYSPSVVASTASGLDACFVSAARDLVAQLGTTPIPLIDAQVAARFVGTPATGLANGLLMGFLREADANQIVISNPSLPGGSVTLSSLLAGGVGNCSQRNDKDSHRGESGWWFHFNFVAAPVVFTGP